METKVSDQMIFIENLSIFAIINLLIFIFFKKKIHKNSFTNIKIYILNKNNNFQFYLIKFFFPKISYFDFKFNDLTSSTQPKIGYFLQYQGLNNVVDKIYFNKLNFIKDKIFIFYLKKNISAVNNGPLFRNLYILEVIKWYFRKNSEKKFFLPKNNHFNDLLTDYFYQNNIYYIKNYNLNFLKHIRYLIRLFKKNSFKNFTKNDNIKKNSILVKYLSNLNLSKPELFTDILFYHSSLIINERIKIFSSEKNHKISKEDRKELNYQKIAYSEFNFNTLAIKHLKNSIKNLFLIYYKYFKNYPFESHYIKDIHYDYYTKKNAYKNLIYLSNSKISFSHFKFNSDHIALNSAIRECGGISTMCQLSYEELSTYDLSVYTDVYFSQSYYNHKAETNNKSIILSNVIIGYPGDYRFKLLKKNLDKEKKIISFFDESSSLNEKWSYGNEQNLIDYSFLLEKIIDDPDLIIYVKPKKYETLFKRLKPINELLQRALKTNRLNIIKGYKNCTPPAHASLRSNLGIHNSLYAATAGIESILSGTTTFYLDHDNWKISKINDFGKDKFIFYNWEDLWIEVELFFKTKKKFEDYHSNELLEYFDPYRDGLASSRMAEYLNNLINGFDQGMKSKENIENANHKFTNKWGKDKIVNLNLQNVI